MIDPNDIEKFSTSNNCEVNKDKWGVCHRKQKPQASLLRHWSYKMKSSSVWSSLQ